MPLAPRGHAGCIPTQPEGNLQGVLWFFSFDVFQRQLGLNGAQLDHRLVNGVVHDTTGHAEFSRHILGFPAMEFDRFEDHENSWRDLFPEDAKK